MSGGIRGPRGRMGGDIPGGEVTLAAYRFKNRDIFTPGGQSGKVTSVMIGEDGQQYAIVDFGADLGRHRVPIAKFAYENNRFVLRDSDVRALPTFVEGQKGFRSAEPDATLSIAGYRLGDAEDSTILVENTAPQITVQRAALQVNWQQPAPHITVHQPTPQVHVRQAQPVIIVRQPPPKITIEIDQPEIIVRMPEPEVDISIADPDVQVNMPKPLVQVMQPEQPQVNISVAEPLISLLPRNRAEIAVERQQAEVKYERIGEPQLTIRQLNGGPRVRYEETIRQETVRDKTVRPLAVASTTMKASELAFRKVYDLEGKEVGSVQRILIDRSGDLFVAMERSLGITSHKILLPIKNFAIRDNRIVRTLPAPEVARVTAWDETMGSYSLAPGDRPLHLPIWA